MSYRVKKILFSALIVFTASLYVECIAQKFEVRKTANGIELLENKRKALFYVTVPVPADGKYARCDYIHPLYGLNGEILTEDFPEDHPYHHGVFWAWHQINYKDRKLADGWIADSVTWEVLNTKSRKTKRQASIYATVMWRVFDSVEFVQKDIIRERTSITVHRATQSYRLIDFDIHLIPLLNDLSLGGSEDIKGYGGFCIRIKLPDNISFSSRNGLSIPQETAIEAGPWMKFSGSFDSLKSGKSSVILFCPEDSSIGIHKWILRRKGSMQNAVYPGSNAKPISEKGWLLNYRLVICENDLRDDQIEKLYNEYMTKK